MFFSEKEQIVLVNEHAEPIACAPKLASHHGDTPLHLAFSVYIFNNRGEILVTQRAHHKKVWPSVWTNSCCGHPMPGEAMEQAIRRRVSYELGMQITDIQPKLPEYRYRTPPNKGIIENEVCPVFFAKTAEEPYPNPAEVEDFKWLSWDELLSQAKEDAEDVWSWWCKDQLKQLSARSVNGV